MHLADMLKFFNRIGVRMVNDVTARVTAEVTVAMDPDGMGVHMGSEAPSAHIEMATKADLAAQESNFVTKADFGDEMKGWQHALVAASGMVTDKLLNVIVHKVAELTAYADKNAANLAARMDDKMGQEEGRVDKNMADLEQKVKARHNKQFRVMDAKNNHNEATIKELESKTLGNEATIKDLDSKTDKMMNIMKKKMRAQNEARDAKDKERDELIASLQRDRCKEKKRPADNQGEGGIEKKQAPAWSKVVTNIYKKNGSNIFRWQKTIKGIKHSEKDHKTFKTVEEASKAMAVYFKNEAK